MGKEYGKLALDQFRDLVKKLPEIRGQMSGLPRLLRDKPEKLREVLGSDYHWSGIYEHDFTEQIGILFYLLGLHGLLKEAAQSVDPQARVIQWTTVGGELDQWFETNERTLGKKPLIWLG